MVTRFRVPVGPKEDAPSITLVVRASTAEEAKEQVLESEDLLKNPTWKIVGEPQEV